MQTSLDGRTQYRIDAGANASMQHPTLIDAEEFCRLAISSRTLVRCDDRAAGVRALVDVETGEVFQVDDTQLTSFELGAR
ncbi:MAG: hypothetical protein KDA41_08520 [Planctomycetales bacterium]|nr:hypothetical protein [Planctomycetales bacterium]